MPAKAGRVWSKSELARHTYDSFIQAHSQSLQGVDEALLVRHGLVAEAADVVLIQGQHGQALADASCQLHSQALTVSSHLHELI